MTRSNRDNYRTLENFKFQGVKAYGGPGVKQDMHQKFCKQCQNGPENDIRKCNYEQKYHDSRPSAMEDDGWRIPKNVWNDAKWRGYGGFTDGFEENRGLEFKGWGKDGGCP